MACHPERTGEQETQPFMPGSYEKQDQPHASKQRLVFAAQTCA
jgi:hypothetical protein